MLFVKLCVSRSIGGHFYLHEKSNNDYPQDSSSHARQRKRIKSKQVILRFNDSPFNQGETAILHEKLQL
jgi:hypothetical protein